jgi:hypothetical protein
VLGLGRIDADETHALTALQKQGVTINNSLHNFEIAVGCGLVWRIKERRKQRNDNDTGKGPFPRATGHG